MASTQETVLELPFRPRARLLQLIGDQLIGSPRLAVFELVKNAYDADATRVTVEINGLESDGPTITITDNGDGMTLKTIRDIWLVPADDHRERQRQNNIRTKLNRLPLGEKGLGRFAVHKLGDVIDLVTHAEGQPECLVRIDWRSLMKKEFLSEAPVTVRTRKPEVFPDGQTGTRILISELREKNWSRGEIRRLYRQITSISSPFVDRSDKFVAELAIPEHPDWLKSVPDVRDLLSQSPWRFSFSYKNGLFSYKYEFRGVSGLKVERRSKSDSTDKLQIVEERDFDEFGIEQSIKTKKNRKVVADSSMLKGIGPIKGEIYVFDRDRDVLSMLGDSQLLQNFLDENGGVRLYRDGIRVYNYGEPTDDWLGLDLRRVNAPTRNISRNIVVGAIDLSLARSDELVEKTNREGFVENDAFKRLRQIVLGALAVLEVERKEDKDKIRAVTGSGKDPEIDRIKKPLEALRAVARKQSIGEKLEPYIRKIETDYDDMRDTMLRAGLSGLGLAVVFHEVEHGVRVLYEAIAAGHDVDSVRNQARELVRVLDGFSELLRKGERTSHSLQHLIKRARDINRVRFRAHNVRFVCPALEEGAADAHGLFAFGLALGALNNLIDNSLYWLKVRWPDSDRKPSPRAIFIDINTDLGEGPSVVVADTGPGFQDSPERLTRPFFSRRPEGMGLGLYYANLVMEMSGGQLVFPQGGDADVPSKFDGAVLAMTFSDGKQK